MKNITIGEVFAKIKTREDIVNFFREQGKIYIDNLYLGLFYPSCSCYNTQFFLSVLSGEKSVNIFIYNFNRLATTFGLYGWI